MIRSEPSGWASVLMRAPGHDGDKQLARRHVAAEIFNDGGHILRLHGQNDHIGGGDNGPIVGQSLRVGQEPAKGVERRGDRIGRQNLRPLQQAGGDEAARQRLRHLTRADESDCLGKHKCFGERTRCRGTVGVHALACCRHAKA